jgi:hypothetical protein
VIAVYIVINALVLLNAFVHAPYAGYDAGPFMANIVALSHGQLPTREQSIEFFSPPLPFALPALVRGCKWGSLRQAANVGQFSQVLLSLGMTYLLLKLCRRVKLGRTTTFCTLVFLGTLPVYYRTFAMVRGEPWVIFFMILSLNMMVGIFIERQQVGFRTVILGVSIGLGLLARQWMIFIVPVLLITAVLASWQGSDWQQRWRIMRPVAVSLMIGFVISSWFFFHLKQQYGSFRAFNRTPAPRSALSNQPLSFYMDMACADLFSRPRRPYLDNRFWPTMYADTFGDYRGHFLIYLYDEQTRIYRPLFLYLDHQHRLDDKPQFQSNYESIVPYLARVMKMSLLPAMLLGMGFLYVLVNVMRPRSELHFRQPSGMMLSMYMMLFLTTMVGYGWFLIAYPNLEKGDTIKPTYILHVFPFLAMCAGCLMGRIRQFNPWVYRVLLVLVLLVAVHNLASMVSHIGPMKDYFGWLENW